MSALLELISLGESNQREAVGKYYNNQGEKIIGYFCNYVPEEIITASGAIPYRILGGIDVSSTKAEAYVPPTDCSFCRSWLEVSIEGGYDFLDGFVSINSCANMIRTFDAWEYFIRAKQFSHVLSVSRKDTLDAQTIFKHEIIKFKTNLEKHLGLIIDQDALKKAITEQNITRQYLMELHLWRSKGIVNAKEALCILEASMLIPKKNFNELFERARKEKKDIALKDGPRILVSGSMCSNHEFLSELEKVGCNIVADDLCIGTRYFWQKVNEKIDDPLNALAERYLVQPPCARVADVDRRIKYILNLASEFDVQGMIYTPLKNCDVFLSEGPIVCREVEKSGLPVLYLEREHMMTGYGQAKVRIEAFLETLI